METHADPDAPNSRPTPEEASAALREVERARSSLDAVPVPRWYVPVLALLVAAVALCQMLPTAATLVTVLVVVAGMGAIAGFYINKVGVRRQAKGREVWPVVAPLVLVNGAAAVLDQGYGQEWGWIVAAVVGAGAILAVGHHHRRRLRKRV